MSEDILRDPDTPVQVEDRVRRSGGDVERVPGGLQHQPHGVTIPGPGHQLGQHMGEPGQGGYLGTIAGAGGVTGQHTVLCVWRQHCPQLVSRQHRVPAVGEGRVNMKISPSVGARHQTPLVVCQNLDKCKCTDASNKLLPSVATHNVTIT